jgi:hypothetical protein
MNIQEEVQKIHQQYGTSEMANYEIQKLFDIEILRFKSKSDKWDKLGNEIGKYYENGDEYIESNLLNIGETAAIAFEYL